MALADPRRGTPSDGQEFHCPGRIFTRRNSMFEGRSNGSVPEFNNPIRAQVHKATEMLVAICRSDGRDDAAIRKDAVADLKEAFAAAELCVRSFPVAGEPEPFTTTAGIFRLVMDHHGVDRSD